jgi:hypothetical protein
MSPQELADRLELQAVMVRYAAGVDERDHALYRSCFADDVQAVGFGKQGFDGAEAWTAYVWKALDKYSVTQHMLGPSLIEVDGDAAHVRTDLQARHTFEPGVHKDESISGFTLWGTYQTDMARIDGRWKITRHELVSRGTRYE